MDDELDELLDSALTDFENKTTTQTTNEKESQSTIVEETIVTTSETNDNKFVVKSESTKATASHNNANNENKVTIERTNIELESSTKTSDNTNLPSIDSFENLLMNDDEMKMLDEIFADEKAKETMKQFASALNMLKTDNPNMMNDFEKLMSQLNCQDLDDDNDDLDEINLPKQQAKPAAAAAATTQKTQKPTSPSTASATASTASASALPTESEKADNSTTPKEAVKNPLNKALDDMNKQTEKILNSGFFPENLFNFGGAAGGDGDDDDEELDDPASELLMQPLISMLFSKEILYPSLKMMLENYEKYIVENKTKLSETEMSKCLDQKEYIKQMCVVYEQAKETDTQEMKTNQLKQILDLLEKCGNPPKELVPDVPMFGGLGGLGGLGDFKENCPIS